MLRTRVIPCLLLENGGLVKTENFKNPQYIGDPINSVRIYNELEVDELMFLDIKASKDKSPICYNIIEDIAKECFMPFSYGGGIQTLEQAKRLFEIGVEKVVINSANMENPNLVSEISKDFGSQAVVVSIDVKKSRYRKEQVYTLSGTKKTGISPKEYALEAQNRGAGEILLNSINHEGTMAGMHQDLIKDITQSLSIPVIAIGGAGQLEDIQGAKQSGASAIALGSMAVYQNTNRGILINFPSQEELRHYL